MISSSIEIVIMVDFNFHIDGANHCCSVCLGMLKKSGVQQLITFAKQNRGDTSNVLVTGSGSESICSVAPAESHLSDHVALFSKCDYPFKPSQNYQNVKFRPRYKRFKQAEACNI